MESEENAPLGRRERRRLEVRARVLEAATGLFDERGYDATTVADICERADIAYGTFFNHFPEKRDVLRLLADRAVEGIEERLEELAKRDDTIERHLILLFEGAAAEFESADRLHRDLLGKIHAIAYTESAENSDRRYHSAFERYVAESVARGRVRSDVPVETLADALASMVSSLSLSWVHFEDFPIRERSAAAARFLADSLKPRED